MSGSNMQLHEPACGVPPLTTHELFRNEFMCSTMANFEYREAMKPFNLNNHEEKKNMTAIKTSEELVKDNTPYVASAEPVSVQVRNLERGILELKNEIICLKSGQNSKPLIGVNQVEVREKFVERFNKVVEAQLKDTCKEYDALLDKLNRVEKLL